MVTLPPFAQRAREEWGTRPSKTKNARVILCTSMDEHNSSYAAPSIPSILAHPQPNPLLPAQMARGANWFMWIFGLSLVNSVAAAMGANFRFVLGLGLTEIVDLLAHRGTLGVIPALAFNVLAAAAFLLFGLTAKQGKAWAFLLGIALFAADTVLTLVVQDWFSFLFHLYAMFWIIKGFLALRQMRDARLAAEQFSV